MTTYVGVDLAWGDKNRTGLAAVDEDGRLLAFGDVRTDEEILAWLRPLVAGLCLVAIDAPLIVRNTTGRRPCEAELNAVFAKYEAGAHPSNTGKPEFAHGTRGARLAHELGLDIDPRSDAERRGIEVYPHPATVALFDLDRTIKYKHKPGRELSFLQAESLRLIEHLEGLRHAPPPAGPPGVAGAESAGDGRLAQGRREGCRGPDRRGALRLRRRVRRRTSQ